VVAVFGKTATLWTSKEVHEFQELVDATTDDPCAMKPSLSKFLAKALCDRSMLSGNGQFANHTCCTMHRNVNIKIVTVWAATDDEHSNPITTIKSDVIVILRADRGILMGE